MEQHDYLPRHIDSALARAVAASPVVILDGPRAAGKTTTARRLAASAVMLPRDLAPLEVDAEAYLRALTPPVLLDEWQLAGTDLLWTIKRIVDDDPAPGRFILTGSVEPAAYGPTYPLTGRAARLVLRPMTRAELEGAGERRTFLEGVYAGELPTPTSSRQGAFDLSWLTRPGFPAARSLPDPRFFLDAYASVVAQRAGDEGRDATRLLRSMQVLATLTGQAAPDQRVWEAADINKATWRGYDDLLTRAHLSVPAPAMESNRLKRLTSYPKPFLADTALALGLADVGVDELAANPALAGRFMESLVAQQLRPQVDLLGGELRHLRTGAGEREIDVVVEAGGKVIALEVKARARVGAGDARQLDWLRDQLGDRFMHGLVVHTGGDVYPLAAGILAVPVDVVCGVSR